MDKKRMDTKILEAVNGCLKGTRITLEQSDEKLDKAGLDSIAFIRLVVTLEDEFNCRIPDEKLQMGEMDTLNKISQILSELTDANG